MDKHLKDHIKSSLYLILSHFNSNLLNIVNK